MPDMRMHIRIEEVQEDPVIELQEQKSHDPAMLTVHLRWKRAAEKSLGWQGMQDYDEMKQL